MSKERDLKVGRGLLGTVGVGIGRSLDDMVKYGVVNWEVR